MPSAQRRSLSSLRAARMRTPKRVPTLRCRGDCASGRGAGNPTTLVLSVLTAQYVLQVSDTRVTSEEDDSPCSQAANSTTDWECCDGWLGKPGAISFHCPTRREMVEHLMNHRAVGHALPDEAVNELEAAAAAGLGVGRVPLARQTCARSAALARRSVLGARCS
jgi:hypothetical protein